MNEFEKELARWHLEKFGTAEVDLQRAVMKLLEEAGEISRAVLRRDHENAREELADTLFVLIHLARAMDTTLEKEAAKKLVTIWKRLKKAKT